MGVVKVSIALEKHVLEKLDKANVRNFMSRSRLINELVKMGLPTVEKVRLFDK